MDMNEIETKKIAYNCRKATFLIEKQQLSTITTKEKIELKIHLAGCSICRTFMQQSMVINKMVHELFHSQKRLDVQLNDKVKEEMQKAINKHIDMRS